MTLDCPTAGFVESSWRRDQHAQRGSQHCMHCHSMVNARDCTLRPKWQCPLHCHSTSSVPRRCAQARVAVPTMRDCTLRAEWQCPLHCHSTSSVPRRCARARVAVPTTRGCTLRPEWQCRPRGAARSGPSGSAAHTATRRRTHGLHALTLPLDVERTETVRPGPSGSAGSGGLRASSRCADARARLPDVSRASGS